MTQRQAIVFVHGMGKQQSGYSHGTRQALQQQIRQYLTEDGTRDIDLDAFVFEEVLWSWVTDGPESELWYRLRRSAELDRIKLRRFMVEFVGDVLAYQPTPQSQQNYLHIHTILSDAVERIQAENDAEGVEFTFVAHSLGSVITSDFLYDRRDRLQAVNLFTLGSPIGLWTLVQGDPDDATCPVHVARPDGVWVNILDDDDVVGYPLRGVNRDYRRAVDKDYVTEIGGPVVRRTPASHMSYWTDGNVVKPIARKLANDYQRLRGMRYQKRTAYLKFIDQLWNL